MFKTFLKNQGIYDAGCLLLAPLDTVTKEKNELWDSNSQLQMYINNPKATKCALRESILSCSHKASLSKTKHKASL
jgi:hypothetical protein